jgi:hypothetical protein
MSLKINPEAVFYEEGYLSIPLKNRRLFPMLPIYVDLFDQNGYDLTKIEQLFCTGNGVPVSMHRNVSSSLFANPLDGSKSSTLLWTHP